MALQAGTCSIDAKGIVTGTGLARALADAMMSVPPSSNTNKMLEQWINQMAAALVGHLVSNAEITVNVTPTDAGLQRTPNPNNPSTATLPPTSTIPLAGSLA